MRIDKFTAKLQEALSDAQSIAVGRDHHHLAPAHLVQALLRHLQAQRLLPAEYTVDTEANLDQSPADLLGPDAIRAIYGWGEKYTGNSQLPESLPVYRLL